MQVVAGKAACAPEALLLLTLVSRSMTAKPGFMAASCLCFDSLQLLVAEAFSSTNVTACRDLADDGLCEWWLLLMLTCLNGGSC